MMDNTRARHGITVRFSTLLTLVAFASTTIAWAAPAGDLATTNLRTGQEEQNPHERAQLAQALAPNTAAVFTGAEEVELEADTGVNRQKQRYATTSGHVITGLRLEGSTVRPTFVEALPDGTTFSVALTGATRDGGMTVALARQGQVVDTLSGVVGLDYDPPSVNLTIWYHDQSTPEVRSMAASAPAMASVASDVEAMLRAIQGLVTPEVLDEATQALLTGLTKYAGQGRTVESWQLDGTGAGLLVIDLTPKVPVGPNRLFLTHDGTLIRPRGAEAGAEETEVADKIFVAFDHKAGMALRRALPDTRVWFPVFSPTTAKDLVDAGVEPEWMVAVTGHYSSGDYTEVVPALTHFLEIQMVGDTWHPPPDVLLWIQAHVGSDQTIILLHGRDDLASLTKHGLSPLSVENVLRAYAGAEEIETGA